MSTGRELTPPRPALPLLIDARAVGGMLGVPETTIWKFDREGTLPRSVEVGGERRWRRKEIRRWIGQGCPDRETWEARKSAASTNLGKLPVGTLGGMNKI